MKHGGLVIPKSVWGEPQLMCSGGGGGNKKKGVGENKWDRRTGIFPFLAP